MTLETYRNRIISAAWLLRRAKTASAEAKARRELDAAVDALSEALQTEPATLAGPPQPLR